MFGIVLDRDSSQSLALQLTNALRGAIRAGTLSPGKRLPATRVMAEELSVSRNIVVTAYEQLVSEGYLESRVGRGTTVAPGTAWTMPRAHPVPSVVGMSRNVKYSLIPGVPDLAAVPVRRWMECASDAHRNASPEAWTYPEAQGERELRREICGYLFRIRGITVPPERVLVTAGTAEALRLLSSFFRGRGYSRFAVENPSIHYARDIARIAGLAVHELDQDGTAALPPDRVEPGSLVYLTPSHQFPRGGLMPAPRRMAFLQAVGDGDGFVLEDDYDSEFRFRGVPPEPMVELDPDRVVYMGSFSKVLSPALRLGFIVVPEALVTPLVEHRRRVISAPPVFPQRALARFLGRGYLEKHLFAMKRTYARRAARILEFLDREFPNAEVRGDACGYHLWVRFSGVSSAGAVRPAFDADFFEACADRGLAVKGEGHYTFDESVDTDALVLGYGNIGDDRLDDALALLAELVSRRV